MNTTTAKALFLGMLTLAILAAPIASADDGDGTDESPCQVVETMTFAPYVVIHPECIPAITSIP